MKRLGCTELILSAFIQFTLERMKVLKLGAIQIIHVHYTIGRGGGKGQCYQISMGMEGVLRDIFSHFSSFIFCVFNFLFIIIIDYFTIIILFKRILHHTEVRVWNNVTKCHMEEGEGSETHQKVSRIIIMDPYGRKEKI